MPFCLLDTQSAAAETPILWPSDAKSWLIWRGPDAGKDWGQEEKGTTEDEMVGWRHRLDGHEFGWTLGAGDREAWCAVFMGSQRMGHDWETELSWTAVFKKWTSSTSIVFRCWCSLRMFGGVYVYLNYISIAEMLIKCCFSHSMLCFEELFMCTWWVWFIFLPVVVSTVFHHIHLSHSTCPFGGGSCFHKQCWNEHPLSCLLMDPFEVLWAFPMAPQYRICL